MSGLRGLKPPKPPSGERRRQAKAYEGAFEAVVSVIIATTVGYFADGYFDSSPIGLFTGVVLGFAAMVLRLVRLGKELGYTDPPDGAGAPEARDATNEPKQDEDA